MIVLLLRWTKRRHVKFSCHHLNVIIKISENISQLSVCNTSLFNTNATQLTLAAQQLSLTRESITLFAELESSQLVFGSTQQWHDI